MAAVGPEERTPGTGDPGDARPGGEGQGGARALSSLALPAAPRGALAHDLLRWRLRLARGRPGGRAAGLAERRRRMHCGAAAGRGLGCGGRRRRRRRQSRYAKLARRPHSRAAQSAPAPRSQAGMRVGGLGREKPREAGGVRRGQGEEKGGTKGLRRTEMGTGEGRPRKGAGGSARRRGAGAGWGPECCISGGGAKLRSWPFPSRSRREGGGPSGQILSVPCPWLPPPESGSLSAPDPLAKDWSRCPGRQQDSYLSPAARAVRALLCLPGTHHWHLDLVASSPLKAEGCGRSGGTTLKQAQPRPRSLGLSPPVQ